MAPRIKLAAGGLAPDTNAESAREGREEGCWTSDKPWFIIRPRRNYKNTHEHLFIFSSPTSEDYTILTEFNKSVYFNLGLLWLFWTLYFGGELGILWLCAHLTWEGTAFTLRTFWKHASSNESVGEKKRLLIRGVLRLIWEQPSCSKTFNNLFIYYLFIMGRYLLLLFSILYMLLCQVRLTSHSCVNLKQCINCNHI